MRVRFIRATDGVDSTFYARIEPDDLLPGISQHATHAAAAHFRRSIGTRPYVVEGFVQEPTREWVSSGPLIRANNLCPGHACTLRGTRKVYFRGSPRAKIVVVGEAPGWEESVSGVPFVGRSGKLLDELLARAGFRQNYIVTNTCLCRPPSNRDPERWEKACCLPRLLAFLEKVRPLGVVCVGAHAADTFFPIAAPQRGETGLPLNCIRTVDLGAMRFLHVRHPAYILRKGGLKSRSKETQELVEDTVFTLNLFLDQIKQTRVPRNKTWRWTQHLKTLMAHELTRGKLLEPAECA